MAEIQFFFPSITLGGFMPNAAKDRTNVSSSSPPAVICEITGRHVDVDVVVDVGVVEVNTDVAGAV